MQQRKSHRSRDSLAQDPAHGAAANQPAVFGVLDNKRQPILVARRRSSSTEPIAGATVPVAVLKRVQQGRPVPTMSRGIGAALHRRRST